MAAQDAVVEGFLLQPHDGENENAGLDCPVFTEGVDDDGPGAIYGSERGGADIQMPRVWVLLVEEPHLEEQDTSNMIPNGKPSLNDSFSILHSVENIMTGCWCVQFL